MTNKTIIQLRIDDGITEIMDEAIKRMEECEFMSVSRCAFIRASIRHYGEMIVKSDEIGIGFRGMKRTANKRTKRNREDKE
jgi:hypothetical protein